MTRNKDRMKKKMRRRFLSCLGAGIGALWLVGCSSGAGGGEGLPEPRRIEGDSIAIHQIVKPSRWAVSAGKAIVQAQGTDSLFYVYRLPDFRFLYAWGRRGDGPGEFAAVTIANAWDGDTGEVMLQDFRSNALKVFSVGDTTWVQTDTLPSFPDSKVFSDDRPLAGGFLGTKKLAEGREEEYFYVRSLRNGSELDSVPLQTVVEAQYDEQGRMYSLSRVNTPKVIARGDRVALVYELVRHIDVYRVSSEGKLRLLHSLGESLDDAALERARTVRSRTSQRGITGFAATDRYIYTLYIEFEVSDWQAKTAEFRRGIVYRYGWDDPQAEAFELASPATDILVTGDDRFLFTRNDLEDFDWVHVYSLPQTSSGENTTGKTR